VCTGFCSVEDVPSPKLHVHEAGDPPVLLSLNNTVNGAVPEVAFAEIAAMGGFKGVAVM
jgi:hypothetical protein